MDPDRLREYLDELTGILAEKDHPPFISMPVTTLIDFQRARDTIARMRIEMAAVTMASAPAIRLARATENRRGIGCTRGTRHDSLSTSRHRQARV